MYPVKKVSLALIFYFLRAIWQRQQQHDNIDILTGQKGPGHKDICKTGNYFIYSLKSIYQYM